MVDRDATTGRRVRHRLSTLVGALAAAAALAACSSPVRAAPGNISGQMQIGGLTRTYLVHVPTGRAHPVALVLALHGGGGTGAGEERLTHYDDVAEANDFAVVYPDGIDRNWADGFDATRSGRAGIDDVGFLTALANSLVAQYGIDPGHVFATGMSNGGFMANRLGCDRAEVFAAIAPVAGTLDTDVPCQPSRPVSVMAVHGTSDPIVPFNGGAMRASDGQREIVAAPDMAQRWRQLDDCPNTPTHSTLPDGVGANPTQRFDSPGCAQGTEVVFYQVDGAGHTWPGGEQYLPKFVIGTTSQAFDASRAGWQFFTTHSR
jgi:polyhydroxybutyrate depolymerase